VAKLLDKHSEEDKQLVEEFNTKRKSLGDATMKQLAGLEELKQAGDQKDVSVNSEDINRLKNELAHKDSELERYKSRNEELKKQLTQKDSELDRVMSRKEEMKKYLQRSEEKNGHLEEKLVQQKSTHKLELTEKYKQMKTQEEQFKKELEKKDKMREEQETRHKKELEQQKAYYQEKLAEKDAQHMKYGNHSVGLFSS